MKKSFLFLLVLSGVVVMLLLSGCNNNVDVAGQSGEDEKILVYTSFYTMYDFAKKIGGDRIELKNLVPSGSEPHNWEPTPKTLANMGKADVFIYNGAGMEAWVEDMMNSLNSKTLVMVETSKEVKLLESDHIDEHDEEQAEGDDDEHGAQKENNDHEDLKYDPHVWLSPLNAKKQLESIKNAFILVDPSNTDYYEKNYEENAKKLDQLDKEYREQLSEYSRRDIIVSHKAFGYLCSEYGLRQVAIEGLNSESEPTPARMAEIIRFARDNDIKVIFFEELVSPKVSNAIAQEIGAKTDVLNPLGGMKEEDVEAGKEYFSVMRDNLEALKRALNY